MIRIYNKEYSYCHYARIYLRVPFFKFKWDKIDGIYEMGDILPERQCMVEFPTEIGYDWALDCQFMRIRFVILGFGLEYNTQNGY